MTKKLRACKFVRVPVDVIKDHTIVVYQHKTEDLKSFAMNHHGILLSQHKEILRDVLKGLKEMHDRNWVHTGMAQVLFHRLDQVMMADLCRCESQ